MSGYESPEPAVQLVLVEWLDSRSPNAAWQHLAEVEHPSVCKCVSVGWLVCDDETKKVLAPNMGDIEDARNLQISGCISIPTLAITAIKPLQETA